MFLCHFLLCFDLAFPLSLTRVFNLLYLLTVLSVLCADLELPFHGFELELGRSVLNGFFWGLGIG